MRRRGFLGFLAGGAVAAPGMAKQAVAASLSDLSVPSAMAVPPMMMGGVASSASSSAWASSGLRKLLGRTAAQHAFHQRRTNVMALDPDLASYRSFALHRKISIQRERQYWRELHSERSWLEATISGWFD